MTYRLTEKLDTMENILVNNKLIILGGEFEASKDELELIRKYFVVEDVKSSTTEDNEDSTPKTNTNTDDEKSATPFIKDEDTKIEVSRGFQNKRAKN